MSKVYAFFGGGFFQLEGHVFHLEGTKFRRGLFQLEEEVHFSRRDAFGQE